MPPARIATFIVNSRQIVAERDRQLPSIDERVRDCM
jgi:hypothetical protein